MNNQELITELTPEELLTHTENERVIAVGLATFRDVGKALASECDGKLYRKTHGTFEAYCRERWGIARRTAYQLIDASAVADNVRHGAQIEPPKTERQARPLTKIKDPERQRKVWKKAVESAPDGKVTAKHVAAVVKDDLSEEPPEATSGENITDDRHDEYQHRDTYDVKDAKQYASMAISQLQRIRDDDSTAKKELSRVTRWIAERIHKL